MPISNIFKKLSSLFSSNDLSDNLKVDLENYLDGNESVVFYMPAYTANHKAANWSDRNIFYSCLLLLTEKRIIICKSSNYLKIFRDIPLNTITNYDFQISQKDNHIINIHTDNSEDIITIHNRYSEKFSELKNMFSDLQSSERNHGVVNTNYIVCEQCKAKIIPGSKFCSNCGKRVKI